MAKATCSWTGCDRDVVSRGYCKRCYKRARKAGTLELGPRYGMCEECSVVIEAGKAGPIPRRCPTCIENARRARMYDEWRVARVARYESERRWADCSDCGIRYERDIRDTKSFQCRPCREVAVSEWKRRWVERYPDKAYAAKRKWLEANRDVLKAHSHRRRVLARDARSDRFTSRDIFERDGWACQICGVHLNPEIKFPDPLSPSLDHIIPIALKGTHTLDNVQAACMGCNWSKGARMT